MMRILICDDHPIVHTGIKYTLKEILDEQTFLVETATSGTEALEKVNSFHPDIFFLDLNLPDFSGLEVLKKLENQISDFKIIILTGETNLPIFLQLSKYQVSAILLKSYNNKDFKKALDHLISNQDFTYLDSKLEQDIERQSNKKQLSSREFDVLNLLVKGYSNKVIAQQLSCSPETIKSHLTNIARKTEIANRDDLVTWFYNGRER